MASHDVSLKVATELPVGGVDLEIPVKRNGRRVGVFTVNSNGVSWNPATAKAATTVSWEDLPDTLTGKGVAATPPAPAKKATSRKTAAKKPADTPAEQDDSAETATAPARKNAKTAAKKSAGSSVDARAVRAWAADNGIAVAPRGPISSTIIDQFRAAN